jgi:peptidoglycan/xylan/chitin deacetylase (PgdA/CDA1 family)
MKALNQPLQGTQHPLKRKSGISETGVEVHEAGPASSGVDEPALAPSGIENDAFSFWKPPASWRAALGSSVDYSRIISEWYLLERYHPQGDENLRPTRRFYYAIKDYVPTKTRHFVRSLIFRMRSQPAFPKWPCEDALLAFQRDWMLRALETVGESDAWHLAFWPENKTCCVVLTHDVESPRGFDRIEAVAELEDRLGFRSAWNLPLDQYPIDWDRVEKLRAQGFEFGAHGLRHDGMLFRSRRHFLELAPRVESLAREHGLRGFRSPSTLRNAQWLSTMDFDFDSSFADTDPYEPQPGGSCSIFPYFINSMVELPYTLPQDHTLINLLRRDPLPVWIEKMNWIAARGGMILTLTHPDYSGSGAALRAYTELLKRLADLESSWRALPAEVSKWWRRRARLQLNLCAGRPHVDGDDTRGAATRRLSAEPILAGR